MKARIRSLVVLMKFSHLLFFQILIVGVFLFPTVALSQVMPAEIGATSLQSTTGYQNVIKNLTPEQQKQLAEYQQMLRQLSPEQQELLQQYQNNSADAGGVNEHIEYDSTGMIRQNRGMRQEGGTDIGSGNTNLPFDSNVNAVGSPGAEFSKSNQVSLASSAEKYFSGLAKEKKSPRAQVPQDLTVLKQFGFEFFANTEGV